MVQHAIEPAVVYRHSSRHPGLTDRIGVLDVLRGIALFGMFLVHFNNYAVASTPPPAVEAMYLRAVPLFFEERFWTMFGILFGVGFAVQLRRAEARGSPFAVIYFRRLLALAGFGFLAHAVFGYNVLLGYAIWGVPLIFVRKWSLRALMIALVVSAASWSIFVIAQASIQVATVGSGAYLEERAKVAAENRAFNEENRAAQDQPQYSRVFRARLQHMKWFYVQPWSFLPVNTLTLFLIGVIGLRLGLFDAPRHHQRLIVALIAFGVACWASELWLLPAPAEEPDGPLVLRIAIDRIQAGFGIIRGSWLAFAYIGTVLLLVARNPAWLRWLGPFAWTGRTALTNYMLQIAILDLMFSRYGLHLQLTPLQALSAALTLFACSAVVSRWWLLRFRYGPLEWLWRSITYGCRQPWRVDAVAA